jgi:hypothetical protein
MAAAERCLHLAGGAERVIAHARHGRATTRGIAAFGLRR